MPHIFKNLPAKFAVLLSVLASTSVAAHAAKESGCTNGNFTVAANVAGGAISVSSLPQTISVVGKYVTFDVDPVTLGIRNYTLTGAPNAESLVPAPLVIYASKTPDLRGLTLTSDVTVQNSGGSIVLIRTGDGIQMKIQATDCATGGIFQMEPSRNDGTATDLTHVLGSMVFYFNNPRFSPPPPLPLCPAGGPFTPSCTPVPITPRVNLASDVAPNFVARDSAQDATKLSQTGGTSVWRVLPGGRMGGVLGLDSVEVAPPPSTCTHQCQAQDQGKGRYPNLGFPSPVPANNRILPR